MRRIVLLLVGAAVVACLLPAPAPAAVLYFEDFGDIASRVPLHGQTPLVDNTGAGSTWVTRTDDSTLTGNGIIFYTDGEIDGSTTPSGTAAARSGSATLAFTPDPGFIYTLTASFDDVEAAGGNWLALGFTAGQSAGGGNAGRFISGATAGQPWMIYRGPDADATTPTPDAYFEGPGTTPAAGNPWSSPVTDNRGDPVDLRIVLNTMQPPWTAEWFAKKPGDVSYTSVGFHTYAANPTIGGVGIAVSTFSVKSTIKSFELTVVPEPSAAVLGIMVALGGLGLRRRR